MTAWADYSPAPFALELQGPGTAPPGAPLLDTSDHSSTRLLAGIPSAWDPDGIHRLPVNMDEWPTDVRTIGRRARGWVSLQERYAGAADRLLAAGVDVEGRYDSCRVDRKVYEATFDSETHKKTADEVWAPSDSDAGILHRWRLALRECNSALAVVKCLESGKVGVMGDCCKCPACPRYQRRRAAEQRARMEEMLDRGFRAEGGLHPTWVRKNLSLADRTKAAALAKDEGLGVRAVEKRLRGTIVGRRDGRRYGWKMFTLPFRNEGIMENDVRTALRLRGLAHKRLRAYFDAPCDGWGAVEISKNGFVHVHFLLWMPFANRDIELDAVANWLRNATCTVAECNHDGAGCNGSYVSDIRAIYDKTRKGEKREGRKLTGREARESWRMAALEAVKYATAPMSSKDGKLGALTEDDAERNLRCMLVLWKKHRVESYGAARQVPEEPEMDDADTMEELKMKRPVVLAYLTRRGGALFVVPPPPKEKPPPENSPPNTGDGAVRLLV